jgi:hypothetical protein
MAATRSHTRSPERTERGDRGARRLRDQPILFLGLFLAPFAGLLTSWLIHAYTFGINWHVGSHAWVVPGNLAALTVTIALISVGALIMGYAAWHIAEHRKTPLRVMLTASSSAIVWLFAISVGVGPHRWWSFAFVMVGWFVAGLWTLTRLNVTRQDPRAPEQKEDTVLEKLGLGGWGFKVKEKVTDPKTGEPIRTVVEAKHAPGDTFDKLAGAVGAFESLAGAPAGLSDANPTDAANRSVFTIQHRDELKYRLPYGPLSNVGGSIQDPITFSIYQDGNPVWCYLAGHPAGEFPPTGYGFMGMTRTGKTVGENEMMTEVISRRDVVILYLNQAKGLQDIRPIIPGVEAAILAEDASDQGVGEYRAALEMVKTIITYRQGTLARFGKSAWDPSCFSSPPVRRMADGTVQQMEPMPALIVHVGEADSILERAGEIATYVASKGLSTGIIAGWSLQRASAEFMPTGLRFNVGAWWCFGCGDEVSAGFALTDDVIRAGAHPEYWKQEKPGYHYFVGPGTPQARKAKTARTMSGENPDQLQNEMLRRNLENAPQMAKLDRGSAKSTGMPGMPSNRWDLLVKNTNRIRNELLDGQAPATPSANMTASDRNLTPQTEEHVFRKEPATVPTFTATEPADDETADRMQFEVQFDDEVRGVREVEGVELYPRNDDGTTDESVDLSRPLPEPPAGDDTSFEEDRPDAPSREVAILALHDVLRKLIEREDLRDPADPNGNTVIIQVSDIYGPYKFKSRPWFSGELKALAGGQRTPPPSLSLERADDLGLKAGKYRLRRIPDGDDE